MWARCLRDYKVLAVAGCRRVAEAVFVALCVCVYSVCVCACSHVFFYYVCGRACVHVFIHVWLVVCVCVWFVRAHACIICACVRLFNKDG